MHAKIILWDIFATDGPNCFLGMWHYGLITHMWGISHILPDIVHIVSVYIIYYIMYIYPYVVIIDLELENQFARRSSVTSDDDKTSKVKKFQSNTTIRLLSAIIFRTYGPWKPP